VRVSFVIEHTLEGAGNSGNISAGRDARITPSPLETFMKIYGATLLAIILPSRRQRASFGLRHPTVATS